MKEKEMKCCPFCGANNQEIVWFDEDVYFVRCMNCGAEGRVARDEDAAIEIWNERHLCEKCKKK